MIVNEEVARLLSELKKHLGTCEEKLQALEKTNGDPIVAPRRRQLRKEMSDSNAEVHRVLLELDKFDRTE